MTKNEIKQELRRSACEDGSPWIGVSSDAHEHCFNKWCIHDLDCYENMADMANDDLRTFFLLVAEAL